MDVTLLQHLGDAVWNPWLLSLFLLVGGYYSLRTGFFQIRCWKLWLSASVGSLFCRKRRKKGRGLTQFQALATALASTIGTGSIAGVATAIFWGGPGAVFWMWVSAFLGMMTGCAEKLLAVSARKKNLSGGWEGGPMEYMSRGLGAPLLAGFFSVCCVAASIGGGDMVQANSIATALEALFGWDRLAVGIAVALMAGAVILGGIDRIGRVSERLVPVMALLFLGGGIAALILRADAIPGAFAEIFAHAFGWRATLGGGMGYGIMTTMRYGVARGVFTNEAGLGSSAMAHAAADVEEPAEQGMWGIFEVFFATLVVCSVTALVILTSGVYHPAAALHAMESGMVADHMLGAPLSSAAFSASLGPAGGLLVVICLILFAFTSLLGWSYYGERSLAWLAGSERLTPLYRLVFLGGTVVGSIADLSLVWQVADLCNGCMALPNLMALLLLSPGVLRELKYWERKNAPSVL